MGLLVKSKDGIAEIDVRSGAGYGSIIGRHGISISVAGSLDSDPSVCLASSLLSGRLVGRFFTCGSRREDLAAILNANSSPDN
jgi:hypothetical protein